LSADGFAGSPSGARSAAAQADGKRPLGRFCPFRAEVALECHAFNGAAWLPQSSQYRPRQERRSIGCGSRASLQRALGLGPARSLAKTAEALTACVA
jgi:hypothetical protein